MGEYTKWVIHIKNKQEIEGMRAAGRLAAEVLKAVGSKVKAGISTAELNDYADEFTTKRGAVSAPYLYRTSPTDPPFPKHICTSVNQVVCHGIPSQDVILRKRDIINCDITVILDGYHGDTSRTFFVGKPNSKAKKLVQITEKAMYRGIRALKPGACVSQVGQAIQKFVAPYKYGIVTQLTGHGIGLKFHEEPHVFHFYHPDYRVELKPGMTLTVEPMLNQGSPDVRLLSDNWTIVTVDALLSAQFEHTCLITETGVEILTKQ